MPFGDLRLSFKRFHCGAINPHGGECPYAPQECARAFLSSHGSIYVNVRNLFDAHDITARLPFGARPVAPRWLQVGTSWNF